MFNYKPINIPLARKIETATERYYVTPTGERLNSVTAILSQTIPKPELQEWKARVGEVEASRVSNIANARGKAVHKAIEDYLLNKFDQTSKIMPATLATFNQMKRQLDRSLTTIYGIETPLFSNRLKTAGTCDLLGEWNYIPSIIDHKTSVYEKNIEHIQSYFLQACMYSMMVEDLASIRLEQLVILIGCDDLPEAQVFIEYRKNYEEQALNLIQKFHNVQR